jgi:TonB family protein
MQKLPSAQRHSLAATCSCFAALILAASAFCQAPATLPSDPKELLNLVAQTNSLTGTDLQPWHLKFEFKIFDEKGHPTGQGTFEEYWAGAHKSKITFTSAQYTQTRYDTASGVLLVGARDPEPEIFARILHQFTAPVTFSQQSQQFTVDHQKRGIDKTKLLCLSQRIRITKPMTSEYNGPWYCVAPDSPALRAILLLQRDNVFIRDNPVKLQDRYLPGTLAHLQGKTVLYTATLDKAETLATVNDADFTPPPGALPPPRVVLLQPDAVETLIVAQPKPLYPPIAQAAHVAGTVELDVTIGTTGQVVSVSVISGPAMLQGAAIEGVKRWTFKPSTDKGEPVQVRTKISVPFTLRP